MIALASLAFFACGDYPIFTEMATNRMKVIIKGTYESNGPAAWDLSSPAGMRDDSIDDLTTDSTVVPSEFMLDIAEMRLQGSGDADKFAFYRQTYNVAIGSEGEPFFNGTGVEYGCDDPYSGYGYTTLLVYIRKMIFNNATNWLYNYSALPGNEWEAQAAPDVIFREDEVPGFDFNQLQYITYWDSLRTNADDILHIFPLAVQFPPGGFIYDRNNPETVLEVRFVVKNFIKYYEYDYNSSGNYYVTHFWGLSDWLRNVRADDPVMGGNVLAVARAYVPGRTATISATTTAGRYVIAIETSDDIANYSVTPPARPDVSGVCYQPKPPTLLSANDPEAILDYYIEYELYKKNLNDFISNCLNDPPGLYASSWDTYENKVSSLRIPPLATYSSTTSYSIINVPIGKSYRVFVSNSDATRGVLPTTYTELGTVVFAESDVGVTKSPL
jgi:hypothetical protein